jgi:hypothetical protein
MVFPPALIGALIVKKMAGFGMYQAASNYGWPRVYKRILEQSRIHMPEESQVLIRGSVRAAIESPLKIYTAITDSHVGDLARKVSQAATEKETVSNNGTTPPSFIVSMSRIFANTLTPIKFWKAMEEEASKSR